MNLRQIQPGLIGTGFKAPINKLRVAGHITVHFFSSNVPSTLQYMLYDRLLSICLLLLLQ